GVMTAAAASLLLVLTVCLTVAQLPRPQGAGETLSVAGAAVAAVAATVWRPRCSVILLTDGTTSSTTVFTELGGLGAPWGVTVFQVAAEGKSPNMTEALLSRLVAQARRVRQVSWCVTVVVVSDDSAFLAASAEWIFKGRLLVWTNRLLALTRRPLSHLRHLHTSFSMMNAMLLLLDDTSGYPRCSGMCTSHSSIRPGVRDSDVVPLHGLVLTTHLLLFPTSSTGKSSRVDTYTQHSFVHRPQLVVAAEEFQPHVLVKTTEAPGRSLSFVTHGRAPPPPGQHTQLYVSLRTPSSDLLTAPGASSCQMVHGLHGGHGGVTWGLGPHADARILADYGRIMAGRGLPEVDPWASSALHPASVDRHSGDTAAVIHYSVLLYLCFIPKTAQRDTWMTETASSYSRVLLQQVSRVGHLPGGDGLGEGRSHHVREEHRVYLHADELVRLGTHAFLGRPQWQGPHGSRLSNTGCLWCWLGSLAGPGGAGPRVAHTQASPQLE
ncbi:putative olfactory ionotropic receptor IR4-like 1, partial [Homarus americanus]